jgi:hypothetical protein
MQRLAGTTLAAGLLAAACGGGGGGSAEPAVPSGTLDSSFANAGKLTLLDSELHIYDSALDPQGNLYLVGTGVAKFDRDGHRLAQYGVGMPQLGGARSPVLDQAGNLYVLTVEGIHKLDPAGNPERSFGDAGIASVPLYLRLGSIYAFGVLRRDPAGNLYVIGSITVRPGRAGPTVPVVYRPVDREARPERPAGNVVR